MEGLMEGIPAVAVSLTSYTQKTFVPAAEFICRLVSTPDPWRLWPNRVLFECQCACPVC